MYSNKYLRRRTVSKKIKPETRVKEKFEHRSLNSGSLNSGSKFPAKERFKPAINTNPFPFPY